MTEEDDVRYITLRDAVIHDIIELSEKIANRDLSGFTFKEIAKRFEALIYEEDENGK